MDLTMLLTRILAAIVIGILSAIAGFISRHWIEAMLRGQFSCYTAAVKGTWKGKFEQRRDTLEKVSLTIQLESKLNVIYGHITFEDTKLKCVGGFVQDRFLSLYYENQFASKLQHGTILRQLSGNNDKLSGNFLGVGPLSERIVAGKIEVAK